MPIRAAAVAALAILGMAVAGCSSVINGQGVSGAATSGAAPGAFPSVSVTVSAPTPSVSTAPTGGSTAGTWSIAMAGQFYLVMVLPGNAIGALFQTAYQAKDVVVERREAALYAQAEVTFVQQLERGLWPIVARPAIAAMIAALRHDYQIWIAVSRQTTHAGVAHVLDTETLQTHTASNRVRGVLGLPQIK